MTTPRQRLIDMMVIKVSDRDYDAWRYNDMAHPTQRTLDDIERAETVGVKLVVCPVNDQTLNEMVEAFAYRRNAFGQFTRPHVKRYYEGMTDRAWNRLVKVIRREAHARLDRLKDNYMIQMISEETNPYLRGIPPGSPFAPDVVEARQWNFAVWTAAIKPDVPTRHNDEYLQYHAGHLYVLREYEDGAWGIYHDEDCVWVDETLDAASEWLINK